MIDRQDGEGRNTKRKARRGRDEFRMLLPKCKNPALDPLALHSETLLEGVFVVVVVVHFHLDISADTLHLPVMRLVLSTRRAAFSWRRCEAIRCRLPYNVNQSRSFSQTLPLLQVDTTLKAQPSAATNDLLQDAFSMETMESYMKARKTLSHEDATAQYKTRMLGPLSTLDLEVQERLRRINSKPDELLRQCVKNSTVSPHVISLCLSAQYQRADKVPRKNRYELLAEQKDEGLARLVLSTRMSSIQSALFTSFIH